MTYAPNPIYMNVNMEVESARNTDTVGNVSVDHKFALPTFSLSGVTVSNKILTLPSGYSYYVLGGVLGGNSGDHSYNVRIDWYDEDAASYVGSRSYYMNSSTAGSGGGSSSKGLNAGRVAARVFLRDADISTSANLSLRLRTFTDGPFTANSFIWCTIYRVPTPS